MAYDDLEHWVCKENIDLFRVALQDEPDQRKHAQIRDLLSQELLKLHAMFPH